MERKESLPKRRSYTVVQSNELIQKTRFNFSATEQKTILYIISKIKPDDTEFTVMNFSINDYCKICGIDYSNGGNYAHIKKTLQNIRDKSFWIKLENGSERTLAWIDRVTIDQGSGEIKLKIDEMLKPYLLQLRKQFTQFELLYTLAMKSQYSIRLYELLKSYQYLQSKRFDIDELKEILYADKYKRYPDFKARVLEIAIREINELSDLKVSYKIEKEGRKFAWIVFTIDVKTDLKERLDTLVTLDKLLDKTN